MKTAFALTLFISGAGLMQAAIVQTISLDLSALHAGSTLSGTFSLNNSPVIGDTAPVVLTFTDPADYTPTSVPATITIVSGTPSGFAVDFSTLTFTNPSGTVTPINTKDVTLNRTAFAMCASFPCTSAGAFQDRSPAVFTGTYTITPAAAAVPEPSYAFLTALLLAAAGMGQALVRAIRRSHVPALRS